MKKTNYIIGMFFACFLANKTSAQISTGELPTSLTYSNSLDYSAINNLRYNDYVDYERIDSIIKNDPDSALICGQPVDVDLDFMNLANTLYEDEQIKILTLKLSIESAKSIGVYFSDFSVPNGFKLFAYNNDFTDIIGSIENNVQTGHDFAIRPIAGNSVILELVCPQTSSLTPSLLIDKMGLFYFNINEELFGKNLASGTGCMPDVHCHDNILTRGRERGVIKWIFFDTKKDAFFSCTASLLNQNATWNDVKPLVYTANHCGKNAELSTAIFFFNFQKPLCSSHPSNIEFKDHSMTGAVFKAKKALSDMFLMELNQHPPVHFNARYLGWHRDPDDDNNTPVEGIHHPLGTRKRYSDGELKIGSTLFHKVEWFANSTSGPTEKGSSGSPLFSKNTDHVIGDLSHGLSNCDNTNGGDSYGKVKSQWDDVGGANNRLKDWLDPVGSNPFSVAGRDPCFNNLIIPATSFKPALQYQPWNRVVIQAGNTLSTSGNVTIENLSEYAFTAGVEVSLTNGFSAPIGAIFSAYINICTGTAVGHRLIAIGEDENEEGAIEDTIEDVILVFPNPNNGIFTVRLGKKEDGILEIRNILGQVLLTEKVEGDSKKEVNLGERIKSGMYFVVFTDLKGNKYKQKFIKE